MFDMKNISKRHQPLVDRIIKKELHPFDKKQICDYIKFYNDKLSKTKMHNCSIDNLFHKLNNDVKISARKLVQYLIQCHFDFEPVIDKINQNQEE